MRGRKPKPIQLQIAEGDPRQRGIGKLQERLDSQVAAERGLPSCPRYFRKLAREAWNFWGTELEAMGIDCRPDAGMLEAACISYELMVEAYTTLGKEGHQVEQPIMNSEGQQVGTRIKNHPALIRLNSSQMRLRAFCSEFGLSPVSRQRLTTGDREDPGEDLMELLRAPRTPRASLIEKIKAEEEERKTN